MMGARGLLAGRFEQPTFGAPGSGAEFWMKLASPLALKFPLE